MNKFRASDVGRAVSFEGFDGGLYKGYLDEVKTSPSGFRYIKVVYRVNGFTEEFSTILDGKHTERVHFLVGPGVRPTNVED